jgi:acyl-coenzyme A thioesterase PaaI-like protein
VHAGIITAGFDNACGIVAFTLMPAGSGILTVDFNTNLQAPAKANDFRFAPAWSSPAARRRCVQPGRSRKPTGRGARRRSIRGR